MDRVRPAFTGRPNWIPRDQTILMITSRTMPPPLVAQAIEFCVGHCRRFPTSSFASLCLRLSINTWEKKKQWPPLSSRRFFFFFFFFFFFYFLSVSARMRWPRVAFVSWPSIADGRGRGRPPLITDRFVVIHLASDRAIHVARAADWRRLRRVSLAFNCAGVSFFSPSPTPPASEKKRRRLPPMARAT